MILKSVKYYNFQLFSEAKIVFEKINAITGVNLDSPDDSANGSGKTTAGISGILFCLYGKVDGMNIADLLRIGEKKASVQTVWEENGRKIIITRNIPSSLSITIDGVDFAGNTIALKERYINDNFGSYEDFRMFRTIDSEQGINLLSLGGTTLRKTMMSFIDDECSVWRKQVLDIKSEREKLGKDKRPYKFYLSKKRLETLKINQSTVDLSIKQAREEVKKQEIIVSDLKIKINGNNQKIENNKLRIDEYGKNILELQSKIKEYSIKLNQSLEIIKIQSIDYDSKINELEIYLDTKEKAVEEIKMEREETSKDIQKINLEIKEAEGNVKKYCEDIKKLKLEIKSLDSLKSNSKCDKCGAKVTEENKDEFKKEKQEQIIKYEKVVEDIDNKIQTVKINVNRLVELELQKKNEERDLTKTISDLRSNIKQLQNSKEEQTKAINNQEKEILNIESEREKYQEFIRNAEDSIKEIRDKIQIITEEDAAEKKELVSNEDKLEAEIDYTTVFTNNIDVLEPKKKRADEYLLKLTEAFKFENYKYTPQDIEVCQEAIKTIDAFAGCYIEEWLKNLEIIINDLLRTMNLSVKFLSTKDFIEVNDNGKTLKYGQLSSGQKTFLNAIFKLSILLHKGQNDGILLADEGFSSMDKVNLSKFITVCNGLNIQVNFIYQNVDKIENVNYINVVRKDGESKIE